MIEAGVVIGPNHDPLYWHTPAGRSMGAIPDSRNLWSVLWGSRHTVLGFAHTHPGGGVPAPSHTDVTTFAAVEAALGRRLRWWVSSSESTVVCLWSGPGLHDYRTLCLHTDPEWVTELRAASVAHKLQEVPLP